MWKRILVFEVLYTVVAAAPIEEACNRRVILDVDAGGDDAMAILMMLSKDSCIDVAAITCVAGNAGLTNVTNNVLKTLTTADRLDIPVYIGSEQGLVYKAESDRYWGEDGFGDFEFPYELDRSPLKEEHAAIALSDLVKSSPGELSIVALGPLTNIALALHLNPNFLKEVESLTILGGSYRGSGNVKPGVEFNMYADPESAALVFSSATPDHPITLVPMEAVERAAFPIEFRKDVLGGLPSKAIKLLNQAERIALKKADKQWLGFDQLAAAVVLQPDIVKESIERKVIVETHGTFSRGGLLIDNKSPYKPIKIVTHVNQEKFGELLLHTLS